MTADVCSNNLVMNLYTFVVSSWEIVMLTMFMFCVILNNKIEL